MPCHLPVNLYLVILLSPVFYLKDNLSFVDMSHGIFHYCFACRASRKLSKSYIDNKDPDQPDSP